ncbi:hypothetical protein SSAG_06311 [Streptomyces sp. Mg1]|nr:hypothetical protein SSAG_06311 [Streptomyces sp. Mg1]
MEWGRHRRCAARPPSFFCLFFIFFRIFFFFCGRGRFLKLYQYMFLFM